MTGTGFDPALATGLFPPLAGKASGAYVVLGRFADVWKPSEGATGRPRFDTTKWAVPADSMETIGGAAAGAVELKADGSFSTTFTVDKAALDAVASTGNYGIYTYAGGGAKVAAYETYSPITFSDGPSVSLSQTTFPATGSTKLTVTGTGFDPAAGTFGLYAAFGRLPEVWKPSSGVPLAADQFSSAQWVQKTQISAAGTFTTELDVSKEAADAISTEGNYGVYTLGAHGLTVAAYETFTPVTFADPAPKPVASTTTLAAPAKAAYGRGGNASVTVKASKAVAGKVQLKDGTRSLGVKAVSGGKASFALPKNLTVGAHRLTATFTPANASVVKASKATRTLAVTKVATRTAVKVAKKPTRKKAGKATVTVAGTPKANGTLTVVVKAKGVKKTLRVNVKNGKAVVKLPKAKKKGAYTIKATFKATRTHAASTKTVKVNVKR